MRASGGAIYPAVIGLALTACTPAAADAPGFGRSIEGDSLHVNDKEVRLFGIDAPEFDQTCQRASGDWSCGAAAADQLSKLVTGKKGRRQWSAGAALGVRPASRQG